MSQVQDAIEWNTPALSLVLRQTLSTNGESDGRSTKVINTPGPSFGAGAPLRGKETPNAPAWNATGRDHTFSKMGYGQSPVASVQYYSASFRASKILARRRSVF
jgi:hypothetical protein